MPMHTNPFQYKHQQQSLLSRQHASKSFKILLQDTFSPTAFLILKILTLIHFPEVLKVVIDSLKGIEASIIK